MVSLHGSQQIHAQQSDSREQPSGEECEFEAASRHSRDAPDPVDVVAGVHRGRGGGTTQPHKPIGQWDTKTIPLHRRRAVETQMETKPKTTKQAGASRPAQLNMNPSAFFAELHKLIQPDQMGWTSDLHIELLRRVLLHLNDAEGNPAKIEARLMNILMLIFRPTEPMQRQVMQQAFAEAGYALDADSETTLMTMFNAAQFGKFLVKTVNPQTGRPFIKEDPKRGVKKNKFAALVVAGAAPAAVEQEEEANA